MTTQVAPLPKLRFCDSNGNALSGGKLFTYAAGTTSKLATYTDYSGGTPNTNPIILDSRGECNCWFPPGVAYKLVLSPSTDSDPPTNPFWTVDNLSSGISLPVAPAQGGTPLFYGGATSGSGTAQTLSSVTPSNFSLTAGYSVICTAGVTNTGGLTLNVNSTGATNVLKRTAGGLVALTAGDWVQNEAYALFYDGTQYQLMAATEDSGMVTLASASTVNIGAAGATYIKITGTTAITAFDTVAAGVKRTVEFGGSLTFTHNATSLILPGGTSITTNAGDLAEMISEGSGNWRCAKYTFAAALPGKSPSRSVFTSGSSQTYTTPSGATRLEIIMVGGGGGGGGAGSGSSGGTGGSGSSSTFGSLTAAAGTGGTGSSTVGPNGTTSSGGDVNGTGSTGQGGSEGVANTVPQGGHGGASPFMGYGSGGDGGAMNGAGISGAGGSSGAALLKRITSPSATYTYTVGTGGAAGTAGTGGNGGQAGQPGLIIVDAYFD